MPYSWFQTSHKGGQWYSDTSPFSIPCSNIRLKKRFKRSNLFALSVTKKKKGLWHWFQATIFRPFYSRIFNDFESFEIESDLKNFDFFVEIFEQKEVPTLFNFLPPHQRRGCMSWSVCPGNTKGGKNTHGGKYHCTVDLLFDWFGICWLTTDNFCFYLQIFKA